MSERTKETTTNRYEWHRKPAGSLGRTCPICDCPNVRRGEHRAVRPSEGIEAKWQKRKLLGKNRPGRYQKHYVCESPPTDRAVDRLTVTTADVAAAVASGELIKGIANRLGVDPASILYWQRRHPAEWQKARDDATAVMIQSVRR